MGDLLADGSAWLESQRTAHLSGPVVYRRGADAVTVQATIGRTVFRVDKGYGITERTEARDFLILVADLVLNAVAIQPKAGDQVIETAGVKLFTYEVMSPDGEPCWRYSDAYRLTYRVHMKLVAVEVAP
ncbi:MAG: hypothetical protein ACREJ2_03135 [Planctomycetota bacterium]